MTIAVYLLSLVAVAVVTALIASSWLKSVIVDSVASVRKSIAPAAKPAKVQERRLTLKEIETGVRKEGYIPYQPEEGVIEFKHEGEVVSVIYDDQKGVFLMRKTFSLSPEQNKMTDVLEKICTKVQDHIMCIRNYLHVIQDNQKIVVFEIGLFIESAGDFEKYFSKYIEIIKDSVDCHRYFLNELTQGNADVTGSQEQGTQVVNVGDKKVVS